MAEPIKITIQFNAQGQAVIRESISDLNALAASAHANIGTYAQGGRALRQFEGDVNRVAQVMQTRFGGALSVVTTGFGNMLSLAESVGRRTFYAMVGGATAAAFAFERLGKAFLKVNEDFANLEITLRSTYKNAIIARELREEIAKITAVSPIPFTGLAEVARVYSVMPQTRGRIAQQSATGTLAQQQGFFRQGVRLVEQMLAFRPDKTVEDAVFAIREAMSGQFRSLVRRFDIPIRYFAAQAQTTPKELATDPNRIFSSMTRLFGSIITPQAVSEYTRQPRILFQNLLEQIFSIPALRVGEAGIYKKFLAQINGLYETIQGFANTQLKPIAEKISTSLESALSMLSRAAEQGAEYLLSKVGYSKQQRPEMNFIQRLGEGFATLVQKGVDQLPSLMQGVETFFQNVLPLLEKFAKLVMWVIDLVVRHPLLSMVGMSQIGTIPSMIRFAGNGFFQRAGQGVTASSLSSVVGDAQARTFWEGFRATFNRQGLAESAPAYRAIWQTVRTQAAQFTPAPVNFPTGTNLGQYIRVLPTGGYQLTQAAGMFTAQQQALLGIAGAHPGSRPFISQAVADVFLARGGAMLPQAALAFGKTSLTSGQVARDLSPFLQQTGSGSYRLLAPKASFSEDEQRRMGIFGRRTAFVSSGVGQQIIAVETQAANIAGSNAAAIANTTAAGARGARFAVGGAAIGRIMTGVGGFLGEVVAPIALLAGVTYGVIKGFTALQEAVDGAAKRLSDLALARSGETEGQRVTREQAVVQFGENLNAANQALKLQNEALGQEGTLPALPMPTARVERFEGPRVKGFRVPSSLGVVRGAEIITPDEAIKSIGRTSTSISNIQRLLGAPAGEKLALEVMGVTRTAAEVQKDSTNWERVLNDLKISFVSQDSVLTKYFNNLEKAGRVFAPGYAPKFQFKASDEQVAGLVAIRDKMDELLSLPSVIQKHFERSLGQLTKIVPAIPEFGQLSFAEDMNAYQEKMREALEPATKMQANLKELANSFNKIGELENMFAELSDKALKETIVVAGQTNTLFEADMRKTVGEYNLLLKELNRQKTERGVKEIVRGAETIPIDQAISELETAKNNLQADVFRSLHETAQQLEEARNEFTQKSLETLVFRFSQDIVPALEKAESPAESQRVLRSVQKAFEGMYQSLGKPAEEAQAEYGRYASDLAKIFSDKTLTGLEAEVNQADMKGAVKNFWNGIVDRFTEMFEKLSSEFEMEMANARARMPKYSTSIIPTLGGESFLAPNVPALSPPMSSALLMKQGSIGALRERVSEVSELAADANATQDRLMGQASRHSQDLLKAFDVGRIDQVFKEIPSIKDNEFGRRQIDGLVESLNRMGDPDLARRLMAIRETLLLDSTGERGLENLVLKLQALDPLYRQMADSAFKASEAARVRSREMTSESEKGLWSEKSQQFYTRGMDIMHARANNEAQLYDLIDKRSERSALAAEQNVQRILTSMSDLREGNIGETMVQQLHDSLDALGSPELGNRVMEAKKLLLMPAEGPENFDNLAAKYRTLIPIAEAQAMNELDLSHGQVLSQNNAHLEKAVALLKIAATMSKEIEDATNKYSRANQALAEQNVQRIMPSLLDMRQGPNATRVYGQLVESFDILREPDMVAKFERLRSVMMLDTEGPIHVQNLITKLKVLQQTYSDLAERSAAKADEMRGKRQYPEANRLDQEAQQWSAESERMRKEREAITGREGQKPWASFYEGFRGAASMFKAQMNDFRQIGATVAESISTSFADAFGEIITRSKSAGQAFKDMGLGMLKMIAQIMMQKAVAGLIGMAFGGIGGAAAGAATTLASNTVSNFADTSGSRIVNPESQMAAGGPIRGGSGMKDDVPIMAMGGEYVVRKEIVRQVGVPFMDALNAGKYEVRKIETGGAFEHKDRKMDHVFQERRSGSLARPGAAHRQVQRFAAGGLVLNFDQMPHFAAGGVVGERPLSYSEPSIKTPRRAVSVRQNATQGDVYNLNITVNETAETGVSNNSKKSLDTDALGRVVRAAVISEIQRQKRAGGELSRL